MASQTLETIIAINAQMGSGFGQAATTLTQIGAAIDQISGKLIDFGEDSVEVYRNYEMSMKDAEVALATSYGQGSNELKSVMSSLDDAATEWAASTIFHTNDVANAVSEAAHAGWDYDQIMAGIPAAMELAQAGSLDLSEAVNYIVKSTNAAGVSFDDLGGFLDSWVYSANSSASTVEEFGEAMLRMGSTMRFADNTDELMTLIAVTANAGSVGSEAGTMIRNSMIRLIAPTDKANEAMSELGATSEEAVEALNDEALAEANARLEAVGFSAYDEQGNLKSILDTYRDLYVALGEISGGYEDITKNQDALQILSAIFPTRTITEALTLIRAASEDYGGLYEMLQSGDAAGYTQYASETMMDSLNGRIETFESKVERLKQVVGESLSDDVSNVMGAMGEFVDKLATMDDGDLGALVGALEVIAVAGPGLMTAGAALRFLSWAITPLGGVGVAAIALTSVAVAAERLKRADLEDAFGSMTLDEGKIHSFLAGVQGAYGPATETIQEYSKALDTSVTSFETASSQLSSNLMSALVSGTTVNAEDMQGLADQMYSALVDALDNRSGKDASLIDYFLGGTDSGNLMMGTLDAVYLETYNAGLEAKSALDQALADAFSQNGDLGSKISQAEYEEIVAAMREYNRVMAQAAAEVAAEDMEVGLQIRLQKAQTASLDEMEKISDEFSSQRDSDLAELESSYQELKARATVAYNKGDYTDEEYAQVMGDLDSSYGTLSGELSSQYASGLVSLWDENIRGSENGAGYSELMDIAERMSTGAIGLQRAFEEYDNISADFDSQQLIQSIGQMYDYLGGESGVSSLISYYNSIGDKESATKLLSVQGAKGLLTNFDYTGKVSNEVVQGSGSNAFSDFLSRIAISGNGLLGNSNKVYQAGTLYGTEYDSYKANVQSTTGSALQAVEPITPPLELPIEELRGEISSLSDTPVTPTVTGIFDPFDAGILSRSNQHIPVIVDFVAGSTPSVPGLPLAGFAEGGRATEASIFGEAGAEWAIPEEHTTRTAELLNAAREASGFTWPELISMYGGLGSKANAAPTTVVYSPTINATDAKGVAQVLKDDKDRLKKWFEDQALFDEVEVYA